MITAVAAGVIAVAGGILAASLPSTPARAPTSTCLDPPCFGGNGLPGLQDLPTVVPVMLIGLAIMIGLLSVIVAGVTSRRKNRGVLSLAAVAFFGSIVVLVGGEVLPHVLSPCAPAELWGAPAPAICQRSPEGLDLPDRWHTLYHAVVGFLPLALVLYFLWRRLDARRRVWRYRG